MNLNIYWHHFSPERWDREIVAIYQATEGWLGFGPKGVAANPGLPYWFSFLEEEKHVLASIEPAGLHFSARMEDEEWEVWKRQFKWVATQRLGFRVGELEEDEG